MSKLQFLKGDVYESLVGNETIFGVTACYFLMIIVTHGYFYAEARIPTMKHTANAIVITPIYHVIQIVLNIYTVWGLAIVGYSSNWPNIFGINAIYSSRLEYFIFLHYVSKILACLDTVFLVISERRMSSIIERKALSFLHVYQYASIIVILGTFLQHGHANGTVVNPII
jgi:hypothetical protein